MADYISSYGLQQKQRVKRKSPKGQQRPPLKGQAPSGAVTPLPRVQTSPADAARGREYLERRQYGRPDATRAEVNRTSNARSGQRYTEKVDRAKGGVWHIYGNGDRVFVKGLKRGSASQSGKGLGSPKKGIGH